MMMKKITAFLLLMCMLVGILGNVDVYADEVSTLKTLNISYSPDGVNSTEENRRDYSYSNLNSDCIGIYFCVKDNYYAGIYSLSSFNSSYSYEYYKNDELSSSGSNSATANQIEISLSDGTVDYIYRLNIVAGASNFTPLSGFSGSVSGSSVVDCYKSIYNYLKTGSDSNFSPLFDEDSAIYDENLGSLKNIKRYAIKYTDGGSSSTGTIDYTWKYTYASTTTTGFNLSTDGASVQYVIKKKGGYKTLLGDYYSLPTVISDYFLAESGKKYFYISSDILNSLIKSFRTSDVPLSATLDYTDYVYLRPVFFNGTNYCYGNWSRTYVSEKGSLIIENGITDGDGGAISSEDDGDDDDFTPNGETDESPVGTGDGTSLEDAEDNLIDSLSDFSSLFKNFISEMTALQESLGKIPALIGNVFTAFPDGVITAIGLGFIIVIFLRVLGR